MKVNIISKDNSVGLSQDIQIVSELIKSLGWQVQFIDYQSNQFKKADINIFLELLEKKFIPYASKNVIIPNPEWFYNEWKRFIPYMDMVICKTVNCYEIFRKYTSRIAYTSFTSRDMYSSDVERQREFLHLAGLSSHKNTSAVIECWNNPLPTLHFVKQEPFRGMPNVIHYDRIEDVGYIMNKCLFHLCPSEYEGFGHYLNEARSCGAVIITTDAPPMNEMSNGFFIKPHKTYYHNDGLCNKIRSIDLLNAVNEVLSLSEAEIKNIQESTRQEFLDNDLFFRNQFIQIIKEL